MRIAMQILTALIFAAMLGAWVYDWYMRRAARPVSVVPDPVQSAHAASGPHVDPHNP